MPRKSIKLPLYEFEFSIIITSYYEEKSIDEFVDRLIATIEPLDRSFEVILVNDGSKDQTFARQRALLEKYSQITHVIDLFANSGQPSAMSCGISYAQGQHYVFIDSDLQLDPEELPQLIDAFDAGADIVSGYRKNRQDVVFRKVSSYFANWVLRKVARHPISDFGCTFKVYNGALVRAFKFGPTKPWKTAYVFAQAGKVAEIPVTHHERRYGQSGWTLKKLTEFLFDHLVGLSSRQFQILAFWCLVIAGVLLARIVLAWLLPFSILPTITTGLLLNLISLNILVSLAGISILGEYVLRNFRKLEGDPIYVVKHVLIRD